MATLFKLLQIAAAIYIVSRIGGGIIGMLAIFITAVSIWIWVTKKPVSNSSEDKTTTED